MEWPNQLQLVLMPGLDGTGRLFQPFVEQLPQNANFKIISYPSDKQLSYEELPDLVLEQVDSQKPFVLVAESFSGPVAVKLASQNLDNLSAAVFCATFASPPGHLLLAMAKALPLTQIFTMSVPEALIRKYLLSPSTPAPIVSLLKEILSQVQPAVLAHRFKCITEVNVKGLLSQIKVPCCYIRAMSDKLIPAASMQPFVENISDLVVKEVESPHLVLQSKPAECLETISEFLDDVIKKPR